MSAQTTVAPAAGQHLGGRAPDAAAGSGDEGHPARQVERVVHTLGGFHRRTLRAPRPCAAYAVTPSTASSARLTLSPPP